ncbi:MAG: Signal transduction response regulator / Disease resistance protein [Gemmatimonadetes bacterium]|nr:Signal transduction response regulator / Disease resistance protein [Gemmatimonadota bacterium]
MTSIETASVASIAAPIPIHLTGFIGRDRELEDLARLVCATRLLTLTGAGGSGKTRLAEEVALRASSSFESVGWIDLAPLTIGNLLTQQIATALQIPERAGTSPLQSIVGALSATHALIVLDNCEHVIDDCAEVVDALLRGCPRLTVLATSREALGVASETAWLVPPLASTEAVQLFVERARATQPSFALTSANAAAVGEICRRLDGIPLAIELAAARVRVLSPEQIARRLDDAFRLLTSGSRTALARHRTLRATMEWSFALLGAREQTLLRRLAMFFGSFSLDSAEAVCAGGSLEAEDILDGVSALVDKSLVTMEPGDGIARYRLLETVRQYGVECLHESGEFDTIARRYVEHFLVMVEEAEPSLIGGSAPPELLGRLVAEQDNLRAASCWAVGAKERAELGLRFVGALYWFWYALGQFREARDLTDSALAIDDHTDARRRGRALVTSALIALFQGEYPRACAHFEEGIPLLQAAGDVAGTATAMAKYGAARMLGGDVKGAAATLDDALELTRVRPPHDIAVIFARFWRGWTAYLEGELDRATELMAPNIAIGRQYNLPTTLGHCLTIQARIQLARDHVEEACNLVSESLEIEVSNKDAWGVGLALDVIAFAAARRQHREEAVRLLAGVEAHRERLSAALPGLMPAERLQVIASLREALGARYDELYAEGLRLSTAQTVAIAIVEAARHTTEHRVPFAGETRTRDAAAATSRLRVLALGPLQVFVDDKPVESMAWGSARPRELLVYLLMHPEGRTKEQVGLAFWPDASAAQLRNSFHVTLHRLRKALGNPEWVTLAHDRYRVEPHVVEEFDVAEFERDVTAARRALKRQEQGASAKLEEALSRFRGDLLDGEPVGDWHLEHRDRLQRTFVDALMELGARFTKEERHAKAAEAYRRVLARDELHEEALLALMKSHVGLGERSQALRAYRRFADRMKAELDADPDDETTSYFEGLQRGAVA